MTLSAAKVPLLRSFEVYSNEGVYKHYVPNGTAASAVC